MAFLRSALAAAAFVMAIGASSAMAAPQVVSVDYARVYKESLAGKDAQAKLKKIEADINKELEPTKKLVDADHDALDPKMAGKSRAQVEADMKKDKAYGDRVRKAAQREESFFALRELRAREYAATQDRALADLVEASLPTVEAVMKSKKASIAIQAGDALAVARDADITSDVIDRLDKSVTTLKVTKVNLTKPADKK